MNEEHETKLTEIRSQYREYTKTKDFKMMTASITSFPKSTITMQRNTAVAADSLSDKLSDFGSVRVGRKKRCRKQQQTRKGVFVTRTNDGKGTFSVNPEKEVTFPRGINENYRSGSVVVCLYASVLETVDIRLLRDMLLQGGDSDSTVTTKSLRNFFVKHCGGMSPGQLKIFMEKILYIEGRISSNHTLLDKNEKMEEEEEEEDSMNTDERTCRRHSTKSTIGVSFETFPINNNCTKIGSNRTKMIILTEPVVEGLGRNHLYSSGYSKFPFPLVAVVSGFGSDHKRAQDVIESSKEGKRGVVSRLHQMVKTVLESDDLTLFMNRFVTETEGVRR